MESNAELDALAMRADARRGEAMSEAVHSFLGRFICYPSHHAQIAHTLWCVHTHLMDAWDTTPRLAFLSPEPASGKTRALEITELLACNSVQAVNMTPAYLFRKVGSDDGATILYDEIDSVFGPKAKDNEEIRALLNAGYRRGAIVGRCVMRGKNVETEDTPAYSAVALAGLGWLPDSILSRAIIIRMRRRHSGETVQSFRRRIYAGEGAAIRTLIENWAAEHADITFPDNMPPEIVDRDEDIWEPLIAIADAVGGDWPQKARAAGVALVLAAKEIEPSLGILLLHHLQTIFEARHWPEALPTKEILPALIAMPEAPWGDLRGKPIDDRRLSRFLKEYDITSKTIRVGDTTPKGYTRADLTDQWRRYSVPTPGGSETSATTATSPDQPADVADVADVAEFRGDAEADGRTDPADGWQFNNEPAEMPDIPPCLRRGAA